MVDGRLSPYRLVPPRLAVRWVAREAARGNVAPVRPVLRMAARFVRVRTAIPSGGTGSEVMLGA